MWVRVLYSLFFYLLTPLVLVRLLLRSRKAPAYRQRWSERFGLVPSTARRRHLQGSVAGSSADPKKPVIWVHSVSVGETLAAVPLIKRLMTGHPGALLVVTTMTPTGSDRVTAAFGDSVLHVYAPYDLPDAINRFLGTVRPDVLVIMETELWPNLVHGTANRNIPIVLANARLSRKSADGYHRIRWLTIPMLQSLDTVAAQTEADGRRFTELGLPDSALAITGNIKFDLELDDSDRKTAAQLRGQWRGEFDRPVWLVASTHRGEDEIILDAFRMTRQHFPNLLLVLVPRHPERFDEVAELCLQLGFQVVRRSSGLAPRPEVNVLLGDTMGELPVFFGACDIAFVGGSLVPVGGHNLIEPAAWGVPVLSGPHLFNFSEASSLLKTADALEVCANAGEVSGAVVKMLENPDRRQRMGAAGRKVAEANRGAMDQLIAIIDRHISAHRASDH